MGDRDSGEAHLKENSVFRNTNARAREGILSFMTRKRFQTRIVLFAVFTILMLFASWRQGLAQEGDGTEPHDWRTDWAVQEGFALSLDSEGYQFPTSIAFVPQPGPGPKDPLYFVTELRGTVKVVTNDRTVYTFAEGLITLQPEEELPAFEGETGLAGICLAPEQGYVFVTFAYQAEKGLLRNNIVRFETRPQTFALEPSGQQAFTGLFAGWEAAISHQIGNCQVQGDHLYVGVGDGFQFHQSQKVDALLGKVLRMTLDGQPVPDNPFYQAEAPDAPDGYVWAHGFRNPFGLSLAGDRLFVADNGSDVDRFVEVLPGENYLWNGNDWSIGARADVTISPDIGPAQMNYFPGGAPWPDEYAGTFFVATSRPEVAGVLLIRPSPEGGSPWQVPEFFVSYQGAEYQIVSGVAIGPDGLYFVPTMPDPQGRSAVFKVAYNPGQAHPVLVGQAGDPQALMWERGCYGCHQLDGEGGTAGPTLDRGPMVNRLNELLNSEDYARTVAEVESLDREPYRSYAAARAEVAQASGQERLRTWMIYHILEPRFDNPYSQMPNMGLSKSEAALITDYLLDEESPRERYGAAFRSLFPEVIFPRHVLLAFGVGLVGGVLGAVSLRFLVVRRARRGERTTARSVEEQG